jgi:hypothetical protein
MTYTDKDLLDLEASLGVIGIETTVRYGILRPDGFDKLAGFFNTICRDFQDDLQRTGIAIKSSQLVKKERAQTLVSIEGPSVATTVLMEKITKKFNVEEVIQFP